MLLATKTTLVLETTMKHVANEKRNATFKNRAPEGNKLIIFATDKNNMENPKSFLILTDGFVLKNSIEIKIAVKYVRIFL